MSSYGSEDLTPKEAIRLLGELEDVLTWVEWWFCGKDDKLAEHINTDTRSDVINIIRRIDETKNTNA